MPGFPPTPPELRFWPKVDKTETCWLWTAGRSDTGYGTFSVGQGVKVGAHRWAYEALVGPVPEGLQLDHLCRVRHCVNPAHLEPVTQRENMRRGAGHPPFTGARERAATHCPHGHPYDEENTYRNPRTGFRSCRACNLARMRRRTHFHVGHSSTRPDPQPA
jgi:hypothetical protein